jgi:uncharacterized protein YfbU (UPF0304 family)
MIKLKSLINHLQENSDFNLRMTVRVHGHNKDIIKRFFMLFYREIEKEFSSVEIVKNSNVIKTIDGEIFSNPQFIISNLNNLEEAKTKVVNIYQKWEKIFSDHIDVDIDFTRFVVE